LRRARGYAPLPVRLESTVPDQNAKVILSVGAHLKNSVALAVGENVFLSQHLGDLETEPAHQAFRRATADLPRLLETSPEIIAADLHPDYLSTQWAEAAVGTVRALKLGVQHHVAHVLSCVAENQVALPALGIAWDGSGFGPDGTVWGGECFLLAPDHAERIAHLRPFRLPGGDRAVKEPRRVALGLLYGLYGEAAFEMEHLPPLRAIPPVEMITLRGMLQRQFNSPFTSSVGRLFDAVASLANLRHQTRFEGQAAMELEFALNDFQSDDAYYMRIGEASAQGGAARAADKSEARSQKAPMLIDWSLMVGPLLSDVMTGEPVALISAKFHNALVESVIELAKKVGQPRVVLSGGCFQNRYLTERLVRRLREEQFLPYWHQRVPTNDGGIALGQIFAARKQITLK
jgi:hydrogenase maturation protein HypF